MSTITSLASAVAGPSLLSTPNLTVGTRHPPTPGEPGQPNGAGQSAGSAPATSFGATASASSQGANDHAAGDQAGGQSFADNGAPPSSGSSGTLVDIRV
jgi:hypothetical protein